MTSATVLSPVQSRSRKQPENSIELQESWAFSFQDYAIEHQGNSVIDISVSYDYKEGIGVPDPFEYPDFVPIYNYIDRFLVNYPNETDFWEILNKRLVTSLLTEPIPTPFGIEYNLSEVLDSLTVRIDVEPGSSGINIPRSSIITGFPKREQPIDFSPAPLYTDVRKYSTTIAAGNDVADIYFPLVPQTSTDEVEFPIALLLQGALVDKADYSKFATQIAQYGFVVVVPNNERTLTAPNDGPSFTGLFAEQSQVNEVLAQMKVEDANSTSPIFEIVDTEKLGLLGHSFGGAVGLGAIQEELCVPGLCTGNYTRPPELQAGIFYGTSFRDPRTNEFLPVNNANIPTGLIVGTKDGVIQPDSSQETYDRILNPPKALITIDGANHYSITNEDNLIREPIRPTLDQSIANETIARWSALFLRSHLLGDKGAFNYIYNTGDALDPNVSVISQTQPLQSVAA